LNIIVLHQTIQLLNAISDIKAFVVRIKNCVILKIFLISIYSLIDRLKILPFDIITKNLFGMSFIKINKMVFQDELDMRPRYKPPLKRKYYHKRRRVNKNDIVALKKRIDNISQKKIKNSKKEKDM
jgi:hypothetical protein